MNNSPFHPDSESAYRQWREQKLMQVPASLDELIVEVKDLQRPTPAEISAVSGCCASSNMAIFVTAGDVDKAALMKFAACFGLRHLDRNEGADDVGITALTVANASAWRKTYIPYTNRAIHWHTDGYYNTPEQQIRGLMLYCERAAGEGGENAIMDHELAWLHLRDLNSDYIRALMQPDAMTIPANEVDDKIVRPDRSGPVFSIDGQGRLHMRYTARQRNIIWKEDALTLEAVAALNELLNSDSPWIYRATLQPGQGLIGNNVLHDRSAFTDSPGHRRLLYRLRFYDRMS
ncbi:MAG: TauD/TfdA family dioxygenase [Pseudomonadota bacterium]